MNTPQPLRNRMPTIYVDEKQRMMRVLWNLQTNFHRLNCCIAVYSIRCVKSAVCSNRIAYYEMFAFRYCINRINNVHQFAPLCDAMKFWCMCANS